MILLVILDSVSHKVERGMMTIYKTTTEEFREHVTMLERGRKRSPEVEAMMQLEVGEALRITTAHNHPSSKNNPSISRCGMYATLTVAAKRHKRVVMVRCIDGTVWVLRVENK